MKETNVSKQNDETTREERTTLEVDGHDGRVFLTIGETRMEFSAATAGLPVP